MNNKFKNLIFSYSNYKIIITIAVLIIIILVMGSLIFYRLDNPVVEVRYIDRVVVQKEVVTIKEYVSESGEWEIYQVTGYSDNDMSQGTTDITATGFKTDCGLPIIAVDPKVIEPFSIVEIEGLGGFVALDTGGKIIGNRIDILFDTKQEALKFGKRELLIRVIK